MKVWLFVVYRPIRDCFTHMEMSTMAVKELAWFESQLIFR